MRKTQLTVSMLSWLTVLIITLFLRVGECAEYEMNTDRPGKDYYCYDLPVDDITAGTTCKADCDNDPRCFAWTYVKPNTTKGPHALCCKKNSLPAKKSDTCCISGVKLCPPIRVNSPTSGQTCYINSQCTINWDASTISNYGTVFVSLVQYDIEHINGWEGGGFPVRNTGSYEWVIPTNVGPTKLENTAGSVVYVVKITSGDGRCVGQGTQFHIKNKLAPRNEWKSQRQTQ